MLCPNRIIRLSVPHATSNVSHGNRLSHSQPPNNGVLPSKWIDQRIQIAVDSGGAVQGICLRRMLGIGPVMELPRLEIVRHCLVSGNGEQGGGEGKRREGGAENNVPRPCRETNCRRNQRHTERNAAGAPQVAGGGDGSLFHAAILPHSAVVRRGEFARGEYLGRRASANPSNAGGLGGG